MENLETMFAVNVKKLQKRKVKIVSIFLSSFFLTYPNFLHSFDVINSVCKASLVNGRCHEVAEGLTLVYPLD